MIDPNEAPEGYRAEEVEESFSCNGCSYYDVIGQHCTDHDRDTNCIGDFRKDGHDIIFKKIEEKGE